MEAIRLTLTGLHKTFGLRKVLRDLSLEATGGEVVAVTGANGSGKSTLLKIVAGLGRQTRGDVRLTLGGVDASDPALRRRAVGYVAPELTLYPELTGTENLLFFTEVRGLPANKHTVLAHLEAVGLGGRGDDPVGVYSSGMRQRLRLALATLFPVPLLLLDEPSLALDSDGVTLVAALLTAHRASGGLVLLATNDPREVQWADRTISVV